MNAARSVLVTGASGFIGKTTVSILQQSGWIVTTTSRSASESNTNSEVYLDLEEPSSILASLDGHQFDAVVHLGTRVGFNHETGSNLLVPNVLATGLLADLADSWNAHFLFVSAAIVHGVRSVDISIESDLCPDIPYARSKWLAEQLLDFSRINHCILRLSGVFGFNGPFHLGLNRAIDDALSGEVPTQVGSGEALRNYIYVRDVAKIIAFVLRENITGTHLLAGHDVISIKEMLQILCDEFLPGHKPTVTNGPDASNQVIVSSEVLPETRGFQEAIIDIKQRNQN